MHTKQKARDIGGVAVVIIAAIVGWQGTGKGVLTQTGDATAQTTSGQVTVIRHLRTHGYVTPSEIANALGWMTQEGLKLEAVGYSQGGPESIVALISGSIDVGGAATSVIINAVANGTRLIGVVPNSGVSSEIKSKWYVLEDSSIKSAQDLKGKTIAVNTKGAHLDYTTREYLRRHGLTTSDVNLVVVPGPQLEQVLRHKQADAVAVGAWQTVFAGKIEAGGGVRVLFTDYDILGDIVLGSAPMLQKFVTRHPEAVKKFVNLNAKAVDWAKANPKAARELVATILQDRGENPELAQYWSGWGLRDHALYTEHDTQFWLDAMVREGKLKPGQLTPEEVQSNKFNSYTEK